MTQRNAVAEANRLGQSIWYDNVRRGLITSGELKRLIDAGVSGLTSNPTIFEKAIASGDYDQELLKLAQAGKNEVESYEALAIEDIRAVADLLKPVFDSTKGVDGYVSLEANPLLAKDTPGTVAEAQRLFASLNRPNVMIKVPATPEGIPAIRSITAAGINVNVTLIFSVSVYRQVAEAYTAGLEELFKRGGDLSKVASVASFFVSRLDTLLDPQIEAKLKQGQAHLEGLQGKAAIANTRLAYQAFKEVFSQPRFRTLANRGARVQRPLWGSTSTKNPAYRDVLYVESLIGADTVDTVPPATLDAFIDHGNAETTIERDVAQARTTLATLEAAGLSLDAATHKLLADGVEAFVGSFESLLANIRQKRAVLAMGRGAS